MALKDVPARWMKASKALKKEGQIYGQMIAEMAKKHSREAFYASDVTIPPSYIVSFWKHSIRSMDQ